VSRRLCIVVLGALLLGAAGSGVGAQDFEVRAYVRPQTGITDDRPFQLIIHVEGTTSPKVTAPRIPKLENLRVTGGPQQNSQFSWSNGKQAAQLQLIYTLIAAGPGPARIPALELEVAGKSYRTEPIEFTVQAAASRPPRGTTPAPSPRQPQERSHNVSLEAKLGAEEVWVGQPVSLNVTLYTAERISLQGWVEQPAFSNFWVEEIDVDPDAEAYRTQIGGREFAAYPVLRRLLVPPSPGEFSIEPYALQLSVRQGRDDMMSLFSLGRSETIIRRSAPLSLRVKQLPGGAPDGFSGAVGTYSLRVSLDRDQAAVNDAVALRATVEGEGVLRAVEPPVFDPLPDLKVFDPKVTESTSSARGKVVSRKTWEWLIVPLAPGELNVPELRFSYFDPGKAQYRTTTSDPLPLVVRRGESTDDTRSAHGAIQLQRRDLNFIKPSRGRLSEQHPRAHQRSLFLALVVTPFLLVPLVVVLSRRRERLRRDLGMARSRRAGSKARRFLRATRRRLEQADSATFHEEVARALVEYVADRFNRSPAGLTYEVADDLLGSSGVPQELRRRFRSCLETCDFARFVPAAGKSERREEVLRQATEIIDELERT
jgi:hypothetical protein